MASDHDGPSSAISYREEAIRYRPAKWSFRPYEDARACQDRTLEGITSLTDHPIGSDSPAGEPIRSLGPNVGSHCGADGAITRNGNRSRVLDRQIQTMSHPHARTSSPNPARPSSSSSMLRTASAHSIRMARWRTCFAR